MFVTTEIWKKTFPAAHVGFLVMADVHNPAAHPALEARKTALERELRQRLAGLDQHALARLAPIPAYAAYYKKFGKTYHVQAQLASVAFKGKSIPSVAALVEALFMAEIQNRLLTAGHDLDRLQLPVSVSVAGGDERYILMRGTEQIAKSGDMLMADQAGVISSILYGPDQRTRIGAQTRSVLFAVYAPAGVGAAAVRTHLEDIAAFVRVVSPAAQVQRLEVFGAGSD